MSPEPLKRGPKRKPYEELEERQRFRRDAEARAKEPRLEEPIEQLQTPRSPVKYADVFSFDDMLASCVAEITKNGMDTLAVPDTIKDWVAGKLLRAFPKQLTQRLLNFMMEQRDFEGLLAFRECRTGDVPEFTVKTLGIRKYVL